MSESLNLAVHNLSSVPVIAFALGFLVSRIKGDLKLPDAVYTTISIYLLFGIGLKGGHALNESGLSGIGIPIVGTIALGLLIPTLAFIALKLVKRIDDVDRGAIAAHYGSRSLVTFSAALMYLENNKIFVEGYATALLTLLEIPGIVVGIYFGARSTRQLINWGETMREVLLGKTIILLVGGLITGLLTSNASYEKVSPFFITLQSGVLTLFLMHVGSLAGENWPRIKSAGFGVVVFAVLFPIFSGVIGVLTGWMMGLSVGGSTILGVLCASASYIAAPAAVSVGLPKANVSLGLVASIGITFPFNLILGIPIYYSIARVIV